MILAGSFHGNLVLPSSEALTRSMKTPLVLIVHIDVDMSDLGLLGQLVFQLKAVTDLIPVLGRRNHNLRPVLNWFICGKDWCSGDTAYYRDPQSYEPDLPHHIHHDLLVRTR